MQVEDISADGQVWEFESLKIWKFESGEEDGTQIFMIFYDHHNKSTRSY